MDSDDSESAPMDLDTTATEQDLGLDGSPASMTPPTAPDLDAKTKTKTFWFGLRRLNSDPDQDIEANFSSGRYLFSLGKSHEKRKSERRSSPG